jgi:hypothetical protein
MSPSGAIVVMWGGVQDGNANIVGRMFDTQGLALTEEWLVSASSQAKQSNPSIAMNASGNFVAVWNDWYGEYYIGRNYVTGRVFDANGLPTTEAFQVANAPQALWPDVAIDGAGNFVVTWLRSGDTYNRPYGEYIMLRQHKADGTPCSEEIALTDDLNSRWYAPSIAGCADGRFVVTWAAGPFPYDILAQTFDSACGPIAEASMVNTIVQGDQGHPCVTTNGQGDYLIVWDSHEPDGSCCVGGQVFTQDGTLPGDELLLSTQTGCLNWYPDVAMTSDGHYAVVWIGQEQDGRNYDVFARTGSL